MIWNTIIKQKGGYYFMSTQYDQYLEQHKESILEKIKNKLDEMEDA